MPERIGSGFLYQSGVLLTLIKTEDMEKIAETYGVQEALVEQKDATFEQSQKTVTWITSREEENWLCGVTDFEPMDYRG